MTNNTSPTESTNTPRNAAAERSATKREEGKRNTITPMPSRRAIGESKHRAYIEIPVGADQAALVEALEGLISRASEPLNAPAPMAMTSHVCSRRFGVNNVNGQLVPYEQVLVCDGPCEDPNTTCEWVTVSQNPTE